MSDEKEGENFKGWRRLSSAVAGNICYHGPSVSSHSLVVVVGTGGEPIRPGDMGNGVTVRVIFGTELYLAARGLR